MARHLSIAAAVAACILVIGSLSIGSAPRDVSTGAIRPQRDSVGYATRPEQVRALVTMVDSLEAARYRSNAAAFPLMKKRPMIGAVCPHDDYLYAGRGYVHVMRQVKAKRAILFGVSHTARRRGVQAKLVFDDFAAWHGAMGDTPVSPMREEIIAALPKSLVLVSDTMQMEEHSLEGIVTVLKYYQPKVEIVPIVVTRFGDRFQGVADTLAAVISDVLDRHRWKLGKDVVILVSADCVHYGDEEWGGRNYAPFGADRPAYEKGVAQDRDVIRSSLTGKISDERIGVFRAKVDANDFQQPYRITWCGVYSIPFGLSVLERVDARETGRDPDGFMLVYGTSLDPPKLPLERVGLGTTAIATVRHWVGYTAIGYW